MKKENYAMSFFDEMTTDTEGKSENQSGIENETSAEGNNTTAPAKAKRRAGRPRKSEATNHNRLTISTDEELVRETEMTALSLGLSVSKYCSLALQDRNKLEKQKAHDEKRKETIRRRLEEMQDSKLESEELDEEELELLLKSYEK